MSVSTSWLFFSPLQEHILIYIIVFVPSLMILSNLTHWLLFSLIPFLLWKLSTHTDDVYYKVCLIFDTKAIYNMSHSCGQWNLKTCILLKFVIKLDRHYPKPQNTIPTISTLNVASSKSNFIIETLWRNHVSLI